MVYLPDEHVGKMMQWWPRTHTHTLDKSRRRDTLFPQSLELQAYHSDYLWLAISHVFSSWEKKQRESLYSVKSVHGTEPKLTELGSLQVKQLKNQK